MTGLNALSPPRGTSSRRQDAYTRPECGSGTNNLHYNTALHFIALIIILVLSTLACCFPIVARRFPRFPVPHRFLFLSRHFGTGVLIATAFVHLLPTAFISLTDPCLPPFWNNGYPAMAGFIALLSVLVVVGVEMFFATRGFGNGNSSEYGMLDQEARRSTVDVSSTNGTNGHTKEPVREQRALRRFKHGSIGKFDAREKTFHELAEEGSRGSEDASRKLFSSSDEESDLDRVASGSNVDELDPVEQSPWRQPNHRTRRDQTHPRRSKDEEDYQGVEPRDTNNIDPRNTTSIQNEEQKMLLQCLLLEAGILFHSVFIGMALSVATGTSFIVLLVAISFHQTFEGIALGSRIAAITSFGPNSLKPWFMALAYGTTTPIGQAIGLGVHNLYDPESEMGLIMVGVFNSLSSGLLLFAGLVELLAADFLSDESYQTLQGRKRLEACAAVVAGALLMALVGAWA